MKYSDLKQVIQKMRHFGYVRTQNGFYKRWFFGGNSYLGIEITTAQIIRYAGYLDLFLRQKEQRLREVRRSSYRSREVLT